MNHPMDTPETRFLARQTTIHALAVVGFVALMGGGIWLAVYSTRYVPDVVGRIGSAAVYLGSVFTKAPEPSLSVVPTPVASTTIPFGEAMSTPPSGEITLPVAPKKVQPAAGTETNGVYPLAGTTTPAPSGPADLVVHIGAIGYLATTSANSFVASSTVPAGSRPAVHFTIQNIGGTATGAWRFSASIPTQTAYIYQSEPQQSLNPGDSIEYTLGFDQANAGAGQTISITANFDHAVAESSTDNNSASAKITVLGS